MLSRASILAGICCFKRFVSRGCSNKVEQPVRLIGPFLFQLIVSVGKGSFVFYADSIVILSPLSPLIVYLCILKFSKLGNLILLA